MTEYRLTASPDLVIRTADDAHIPNDPGNRDWVEYQGWLAAGGVPDPYVPPEPPNAIVQASGWVTQLQREGKYGDWQGWVDRELTDDLKLLANRATGFKRGGGMIDEAAASLGWVEEEVDSWFEQATLIEPYP